MFFNLQFVWSIFQTPNFPVGTYLIATVAHSGVSIYRQGNELIKYGTCIWTVKYGKFCCLCTWNSGQLVIKSLVKRWKLKTESFYRYRHYICVCVGGGGGITVHSGQLCTKINRILSRISCVIFLYKLYVIRHILFGLSGESRFIHNQLTSKWYSTYHWINN